MHAGGLGDHLAYSVLPRLYKRAGARKVLISSETNYGEAFARNPEIADLVWKRNPFLDGFTDDPPNTGETGWPPEAYFAAAKTAACPIDIVAKVHGLSITKRNGSRILPERPDFFYSPKPKPEFADKIVCDPYSTSQAFSPHVFEQFVRFVAQWHKIDSDKIIVLESAHAGKGGIGALPDQPRHRVRDIFEYADIIGSAKYFLVTEAGGQSLAAAIRAAGAFVLTTTRAYNERNFLWPANTYCVTGQMTPGEQEWPMRRPV